MTTETALEAPPHRPLATNVPTTMALPTGALLSVEAILATAAERLPDPPRRRYERARGLQQLLRWLNAYPGQDWQQRWEAAQCDDAGRSWGQKGFNPYRHSLQSSAVIALVVLEIIRPSTAWLRTATPPHLFTTYRNVVDTGTFTKLEEWLREHGLSNTSRMLSLNALTLIRIRTNTPLLNITAAQFLEVNLEWTRFRGRSRAMGVAWQALQACGAVSRPTTDPLFNRGN